MKKILSLVLVLVMVFALIVPATAASKTPDEIKVDGVTVSAAVEKLNGNQNKLWITITDKSGSKTEPFMIAKH